MARFTGKAVVITGGSSGIGPATARRIVAEGGRALVTLSEEQVAALEAPYVPHPVVGLAGASRFKGRVSVATER